MILISGEALIDLIPDPVKANAYDAVLGGSPYNVAIGLARLGSQTAFVSRISADGNGEALAAALADNGVDLAFVQRDKRPTTLAFVMRGTAKTGSRYSFYLDATSFDGPWPFPTVWPKSGRHLHVGSIAAVDPRHGETVVAALKAAREKASISFDPNIRPLVTPDRNSVTKLVERQASLAQMVKASEEDLEWLYPGRSIEETLSAWTKMGPCFCVATRGERGALAILGNERIEVPAPVIDVVDTVGAGDSFMSALLSATDRDAGLGANAVTPTRAGLELRLSFAAAASAITCTRKGSNPPTRVEVEAMLKG
jgi:fructokinase